MKRLSFFAIVLMLQCSLGFSQVAVNSSGASPDSSAMLDVQSTTMGLLAPRMSFFEMNQIDSPATGLLVFCTHDNLFYVNRGTPVNPEWHAIHGLWETTGNKIYYNEGNVGIGTDNPGSNLDVRGSNVDDGAVVRIGNSNLTCRLVLFGGRKGDPNPFIQWKEGDPLRFSTDEGGWSEKMRITSEGQVAIGTESPDGSAAVDVYSTTQGFLPPRLTAHKRESIQNPATGLMIFCTTTNKLNVYNGTDWYELHQTVAPDPPVTCPSTFDDIDGNTYNTVLIGTQCWMKENLKTTTYSNGISIPNVINAGAWSGLSTGAYVWYDNSIGWKDSYGALYNWYATVDGNGLCPAGWHVPTHAEWTALTNYIGGTSSPHGNELKSCRQVNSPLGGDCDTTVHPRWNEDAAHYGTDDYDFSGLPGALRDSDGTFFNMGATGHWWSSTESSSSDAWHRDLYCFYGYVGVNDYNKRKGFSVRCLRD